MVNAASERGRSSSTCSTMGVHDGVPQVWLMRSAVCATSASRAR